MKRYVIESTVIWTKKDGTTATDVSYFQEHVRVVLPMNCMVGNVKDAKKYDFKTEANREKRKYFGNAKRVKVVAI